MYTAKFGVRIKTANEIKFIMTADKIYQCCGINFSRIRQYVFETIEHEGVPDEFTEDEVINDFILYCRECGWIE